jgi:hypothetical protein
LTDDLTIECRTASSKAKTSVDTRQSNPYSLSHCTLNQVTSSGFGSIPKDDFTTDNNIVVSIIGFHQAVSFAEEHPSAC